MKRIISLLFAFAMTLNMMNIATADAHVNALNDEERTLLELVGVIDEGKELDMVLTRGEFTEMLAKVAFGLNADIPSFNNGKTLSDVWTTDLFYDEANALYNRGYITADNFGCFYPEREITIEEATDMAVGVLGYSKIFVKKLFNQSTQTIASEKGLYDGITASEGKLNVYNAYKIIYNMLTADVSDLILFGNNDGETMFMSSRLFLYEIEGIVTDDGFTSLYGASEISEDYIAIDGKILENKTGIADILGYNVKGYYEYSPIEDEAVLLAVGEKNNRNDVTVLLSKDIESYKDRIYTYYEDEFAVRAKKAEIPKNAVIVYNGKSLAVSDEFDISKFTPEHGRVKLHDNNKDGKIDIVKIEDYKTAIVYLHDLSEGKIYLKNNLPAIVLEDKKFVIEDKNGKKMDSFFAGLSEDNVISYAESLDGEYIKIIMSDYSQQGRVASIEYEDKKIVSIRTSADGIYEFAPHAQDNYSPIETGATYTFYFDAFGMVVGYEKNKDANDWLWGSLVSIKLDTDSGEDVSIAKIYTPEDEFVNLWIDKKVKVILEDDTVKKYTSAAASTLTYTGIIRYKTNNDDYINCIELPHAYGSIPTVEDRLFVMVDTVSVEGAEKDYYVRKQNNNVTYGGIALINDKTKVFAVPSDVKKYEDYGISASSAFSSGIYYSLYLYGTDYRSKNAACACLTSGSISTTNITNEYPMTIKTVDFTYDESKGEAIYKLTCLEYNGTEKEYYMEQETYEKEVFNFAAGDGQTPVKLQEGDMIYYAANNDELTAAVVLYDSDRVLKDERGKDVIGGVGGGKISYYSSSNLLCNPFGASTYLPGQTGNINSWKYYGAQVRIWVGWVYSVEDGFFQITNQNPAYGYDHGASKDNGFITEIFVTNNPFVTTEINGKKVNVRKGSVSDIKPYTIYGADCSRVVITQRAYDTRSFNIIND